jgi:monovalent cation:H+ antiporter-2, CPA2 family
MEEVLFSISVMCLAILLLIFLLKKIQQPYLIAYVLAGILLGPYVTGVYKDSGNITALGEVGIILMMFFLGIEIEIPDNKSLLRMPLIAQAIKTLLSSVFAVMVGEWLNWDVGFIVLLIIIMSFNSTAVVSEFLRKNNELNTPIVKTVLNVLLLQDFLVAPVFTAFQFLSTAKIDISQIIFAIVACILIFLLLRAIRNRNLSQWQPFRELENDHELQVFAGMFICLGFALLASFIGLTPAVGSFIAGVYIGRLDAFNWLERVLHPFKIFFVSLFFVSVGLMLDLRYIGQHYEPILVITTVVLLINSVIGVLVFRIMKFHWKDCIYAGALLSQTGEFGLLACSLAFKMQIINENFFKTALAVLGLSLTFSTIWMTLLRKLIYSPGEINKLKKKLVWTHNSIFS